MLGVFCGEVVEAPAELDNWFTSRSTPAMSVQIGSLGPLLTLTPTSHPSPSAPDPLQPRMMSFVCLRVCWITWAGSLRQQYGLSKSTNESVLLIEAYKALCDRAPHPPSFMLGLLDGTFAFVLFDATVSMLLVASVHDGKVPLFWGITLDGYVAFADDLDLLKGSCGKSLVLGKSGGFYPNGLGGLKSYENPKHKVIAVLATEEETWCNFQGGRICRSYINTVGNTEARRYRHLPSQKIRWCIKEVYSEVFM